MSVHETVSLETIHQKFLEQQLLILQLGYFCTHIQYVHICDRIWKITHMVVPATIRIFEFSMALLIAETIAETTFKNICKLYL